MSHKGSLRGPPKEGWAQPVNARKNHYFVDGRSLCRGWLFFGSLQRDDPSGDSSNDCRVCLKKVKERREEAGL